MFEDINLNEYTGVIRLSSAHAMVIGHLPTKVKIDQLAQQLNSDNNQTKIESFGLWEVATPNYATFYPDVTPEDFNPKEEEFIEPVFRLLSETIVSKGAPIDFGKEGVLKNSMKKLLGQTINIDHETAIGNAIGSVSEVYWQESYKTKSGVVVPAGINGKFKIDGKSNPRIARGIMMSPPSIHSNSVTVRFKWEPSHKFDTAQEFYDKVGTYDKKGELIRLVVSEISSYSETSLVSHGADPYAQRINENGEINNPEYAARQYSFSADNKQIKGVIDIDFKTSLTADEDSTPPQNNNNTSSNKENKGMELLQEIVKKFSLEVGEALTQEKVLESLTAAFDSKETALQDKDSEIATLKEDKSALETELEEAKTKAETLGVLETQNKEEAKRLYRLTLAEGEEADETFEALIDKADIDGTKSFITKFSKEVEEKFKPTCKKCGSSNVTMASSQEGEGGKEEQQQTSFGSALDIKTNFKAKYKKK